MNATSQYLRTGICMVLSLYSTRIILEALGKSDFGLYSLIGSVVMMLGFVTSSLSTSTQRFLSFSWGKNDINTTRSIFSNAMGLHAIIGMLLMVVLLLLERPLVHSYLNIDPARIETADFVYYMVILILVMTIITAPVKALFIARENIVYSSIIDIIDGTIKLAGAIGLSWIAFDKLKAYAMLMAGISIFAFLAYFVYAKRKYEECHIPRIRELSVASLKNLMGFTAWNIYSVGSTVVRTQGLAVRINRFFGTLINSSYGIALQVSNTVNAVAASVVNAMNPQLMKAEGRGDRKEMLLFTTLESKYSFLLLSTLFIPIVVELPSILSLWLKSYPENTLEFCTLVILTVVIDQSTIGLTSANQAIGKIRNYSLLISTIRLLTLPAAWLSLYLGGPPLSVMVVYMFFATLCGLVRIPFIHYTAGLDIYQYCKEVYLRTLIPVAGNLTVAFLVSRAVDGTWSFLLTEVVAVSFTIILIYIFSLSSAERMWIRHHLPIKILRK